jgi:hypothetical protein
LGEREGEIDFWHSISDYNFGLLELMKIPAMVDFPTPPLADETAIIFFTSLICRFCGRPLCIRGMVGGAPLRGSP